MRDTDRSVHALLTNGLEVVRYDRAGKYRIEDPNGMRPPRTISVKEAARVAYEHADAVFLGLPGGRAFDRLFHRLNEEAEHAPR